MATKNLEKCKFGQRVEMVFLDHSSANNWQTVEEVMESKDYEIQLIGYYIGSTKYSQW
jgi:hypothetical protein